MSFAIRPGETLGLVGESGSGKSVTALSIIRLVMPPGRIAGGRIELDGRNLLDLAEKDMRAIRGRRIGFVFQEPMVALDPVYTIGSQIAETLAVHGLARGAAAKARAVELLAAVRVPDPAPARARISASAERRPAPARDDRARARRRAGARSSPTSRRPRSTSPCRPRSSTCSRDMRRAFELSLLLITHDLGVVAEMADRVAVMYAGRIVEQAPVARLFSAPAHPYTRGLLASIPGGHAGERLTAIPGSVPALGHAAGGLRVRAALRRSLRAVRGARAGDHERRVGARRPLLPQRAGDAPGGQGPRVTPLLDVRHLVKEFPGRGGLF